jgi:hypothetical protein
MRRYRDHKNNILNFKRKRDKVFDDFAEKKISKTRKMGKAKTHTKQY